MAFAWYGRRDRTALPPRRMIYFGLEAAQDLTVTVRDLRRTVRLLQSGFTTLFPDEALGLHLRYSTLDRDLMQVERTCQELTTQLLTALASTSGDIARLAALTCPATRGVWINKVYLVPTGGVLTDQSGVIPVSLDAQPFRLILHTVQATAIIGGYLDPTALAYTVDNVVNLVYLLIGTERPQRLRAWTEQLQETDASVRPTLLCTSMQEISQAIQPLVRTQMLIQDPPNAAVRDPNRELQWPEAFLP